MNTITKSRRNTVARRPAHRVSRSLAAAALCVTAAVGSVGLSATSASAATVVTWQAKCTTLSGSLGRILTVYLNSAPVGTTIQADLYKYVPSTGAWAYQNAGEWSRVNSAGFWQRPGYPIQNFLQLNGWSAGYYALYINQWNAQNVRMYQGWSNYCYYAS
jgi:hypothetical protein